MTDQREPQYFAVQVLEMVRVLHERGYEHLRVAPGMAPSGMSWRCAVTHTGNIRPDHGAKARDFEADSAHYTSAAGGEYFQWTDAAEDTPEELAAKFIARFPEIAGKGRGPDPAYAQWFLEMLALARQGTFAISYADWNTERDPGFLDTVGATKAKLVMPPNCPEDPGPPA